MQAVTRVKLEQAWKVKMWMPARLYRGEGPAGREEINERLFRSTGVVSTAQSAPACREGDPGQWGRLGTGGGRDSERRRKGHVQYERRTVAGAQARHLRPDSAEAG